jgi:hypothetical protein
VHVACAWPVPINADKRLVRRLGDCIPSIATLAMSQAYLQVRQLNPLYPGMHPAVSELDSIWCCCYSY